MVCVVTPTEQSDPWYLLFLRVHKRLILDWLTLSGRQETG